MGRHSNEPADSGHAPGRPGDGQSGAAADDFGFDPALDQHRHDAACTWLRRLIREGCSISTRANTPPTRLRKATVVPSLGLLGLEKAARDAEELTRPVEASLCQRALSDEI